MKWRCVRAILAAATFTCVGLGWPGVRNLGVAPAYAQSDTSDQSTDGSQPAPSPIFPEFIGQPTNWVNTDGKALRMHGPGGLLDGKHVILIDFWDYTCVNCIRTLPHLKLWDERYRKLGLVIIGIHTPEFRFAHDPANVQAAVTRFGIKYPVLIDSDANNWAMWNTNMWPRHILIDPAGQVTEDQCGEGHYDYTELKIRDALREIHSSSALGPIVESDSGNLTDTSVPNETPEMYCGYKRGSTLYTGITVLNPDVVTNNVDNSPGDHPDGSINLSGSWRIMAYGLAHASIDPTDYVVIHYHGPDANVVIKPESKDPVNLFVVQDGNPLPKEDAGSDILYDDNGQSYIHVDTPRMYSLTKNPHHGGHELMLQTASEDFTIYSFSF